MKYLVAVDGSEHADNAFQYALTLIKKETDELQIISVLPSSRFGELLAAHKEGPNVLGEQEARTWDTVARCQAIATAAEIKVSGEVSKGDVRHVICQSIVDNAIDIVVVGARGLGTVKRLVLGSVSSYVLAHCQCSVLIVKHKPRAVPNRTFLFANDGSPASNYALDALMKLAHPGDSVVLVHAFQNALLMDKALSHAQGTYDTIVGEVGDSEAAFQRKALADNTKKCADQGLTASADFAFGDPREVLSDLAQRQYVDMTVVGCRSLSTLQWWYVGSVSNDVAMNVDCGAVFVAKLRA